MARKDLNDDLLIVTSTQIAKILGYTTARIRQLENDGALVKIDRGKYDLSASIQRYIEYLKEDDGEELNKTNEEALWTRARRQTAELKLQIMKGELHRSEDVRRVMNTMLAAFRSRIIVIPSKISPMLLGKTEIAPIKETLKDALYEALNELSDYDPHVFYSESKDDLALDEDEAEEIADQVEEGSKKNGQREKKK